MIFTVDGERHEFDEDKMTFAEGRALEKVTGHLFGELGSYAQKGDLSVLQGFVWVAMKRSEPTLKFSDLDDRSIGDFVFDDEEPEDDEVPTGGDETSSPAA
jgi:hypothetical protein